MLERMKPRLRQYNDGLKSGHAMAGGTVAPTNIDDESLQPIFVGGARRTIIELPLVFCSITRHGPG